MSFFEFKFLDRYSKLVELAGIGIMIAASLFYSIYDDSFRFKHNFSAYIILILLSLPFSMLMANIYHNQSMGISLYSQRSIYYYFLYFVLHQIKVKPKDFEKIFLFLAITYVFFYLLQYFVYPHVIFGSGILKDRGTLRISIFGLSYMMIGYFVVLQVLLKKNQVQYLFLLIVFLVIIILIGSRMLLLSLAAVTLLNLAIVKRVKSRLAIYGLVITGMILLFFAFQNVFQELISVTKETRAQGIDNIRIKAAKYFLSRFFPSKVTYVFGNGASSATSEYSAAVTFLSLRYGYYLSDIGIIGNYVNFGVLFVLGIFALIYKVLKTKIQSQYHYIKYFFILNALCIITAGGFAQSDFIVLVTITLYMMDVSKSMINIQNPDIIRNNQDQPVQIEDTSET